MDLFKDLLPSILKNKEHLLNSEDTEKEYTPFVVNKSLSQHIDCIFLSNEMNMNHHLDNKLQYDFYFHSVKPYKRNYEKWFKYKETKEIEQIKEYYNCSSIKAKGILSVLTPEQLKIIQSKLDKGGKAINNK
jgi:hypothetical protein